MAKLPTSTQELTGKSTVLRSNSAEGVLNLDNRKESPIAALSDLGEKVADLVKSVSGAIRDTKKVSVDREKGEDENSIERDNSDLFKGVSSAISRNVITNPPVISSTPMAGAVSNRDPLLVKSPMAPAASSGAAAVRGPNKPMTLLVKFGNLAVKGAKGAVKLGKTDSSTIRSRVTGPVKDKSAKFDKFISDKFGGLADVISSGTGLLRMDMATVLNKATGMAAHLLKAAIVLVVGKIVGLLKKVNRGVNATVKNTKKKPGGDGGGGIALPKTFYLPATPVEWGIIIAIGLLPLILALLILGIFLIITLPKLVTILKDLLLGIIDRLLSFGEKILDFLTNGLIDVLRGLIDLVIDSIIRIVTEVPAAIIEGILDAILSPFKFIKKLLSGGDDEEEDESESKSETKVPGVDLVLQALTDLKELFLKQLVTLKTFLAVGAAKSYQKIFTDFADSALGKVSSIAESAKKRISDTLKSIQSLFELDSRSENLKRLDSILESINKLCTICENLKPKEATAEASSRANSGRTEGSIGDRVDRALDADTSGMGTSNNLVGGRSEGNVFIRMLRNLDSISLTLDKIYKVDSTYLPYLSGASAQSVTSASKPSSGDVSKGADSNDKKPNDNNQNVGSKGSPPKTTGKGGDAKTS